MSTPVTKTKPVQFTASEYYFSDLFQNPISILNDFPIVKLALSKIFLIPPQKKDPDLLESVNILGRQISSVVFALSLCSLSWVPTICSAALIIIFKKTLIELQEKKKVSEKLQEISSKVDNLLSTMVLTSTSNTKELSSKLDHIASMIQAFKINAKEIKETTKDLRALKKEEKLLLAEYEKIQAKYNIIAEFLGQKCAQLSHENSKLSKVRKKLNKEVNRLTSVKA